MDYSGAPALSYALRRSLWTPEQVGVSTNFQSTLANVRFFIPNAEIVGEGSYHTTSPFLTTYIEKFSPTSTASQKEAWQYDGPQELIDKISQFDGLPILAHPWTNPSNYASLSRYRGIEIYNAYAEFKGRTGDPEFAARDHNAMLIALWDQLLKNNQNVLGVAVNDHFGPDNTTDVIDPDIRDSGKIIALATAMDLISLRNAFDRGAVLAVQDRGTTKDRYPTINSITISRNSAVIDTTGTVQWLASGRVIAATNELQYSLIPALTTYVRAEITNSDRSIVYTQAFAVRLVGDANGDGVLDSADTQVCAAVQAGNETDVDRVNACRTN
jgi:hypothetical protein